MGHATFGPMWPRQNQGIIVLVRKDGLRLPIHKTLAPLASLLMDLTELSGYNIIPGHTWGYANRPISGTSVPSNHSQGTALDINAPANPYASADWHKRNARGTRPFGLPIVCDIPQSVVSLWEGHGFTWGGRYKSKPDPMHFEFMLSTEAARNIYSNLRKFLGQSTPPPPTPILTPEGIEDMAILVRKAGTDYAESVVLTDGINRSKDNLSMEDINNWKAILGYKPGQQVPALTARNYNRLKQV